jgi:hypothetical protein
VSSGKIAGLLIMFRNVQMLFATVTHLDGGLSLETLIAMSRVRVVIDGVGLVIGFIKLLQLVTKK